MSNIDFQTISFLHPSWGILVFHKPHSKYANIFALVTRLRAKKKLLLQFSTIIPDYVLKANDS